MEGTPENKTKIHTHNYSGTSVSDMKTCTKLGNIIEIYVLSSSTEIVINSLKNSFKKSLKRGIPSSVPGPHG
jgi:uncharacterized protein YvpB